MSFPISSPLEFEPPKYFEAAAHLYGVGNSVRVIQMLPSALRDYKRASAKAIEVQIPDRSSAPSEGCLQSARALVRELR